MNVPLTLNTIFSLREVSEIGDPWVPSHPVLSPTEKIVKNLTVCHVLGRGLKGHSNALASYYR